MNGIELETRAVLRTLRADEPTTLQRPRRRVRRVEHHQQTMVNWLNPPDQSPLETTIGFEQVAIEVTACARPAGAGSRTSRRSIASGCSRDFDHLYRLRRRSWTGWRARTPITSLQSLHRRDAGAARPPWSIRAPEDDLRSCTEKTSAARRRRISVSTRHAWSRAEHQAPRLLHDHLSDVLRSDGAQRLVRARFVHVEEQHVTYSISLISRRDLGLEWLITEDPASPRRRTGAWARRRQRRAQGIWERFLDDGAGTASTT